MASRQVYGFVQRYAQFPLIYRRLLTTAVQKSESSSTTSSSSNQENVAIYPQIKSQVQLLLNEDPQTVFSRLDKICYEHSNSLKQLQDISDKQTKKKPLTDAEKFPINANQMLYMLRLIIDSKTLDDPMQIAVNLAKMLTELNLTKLDDSWLKVLIKEMLDKNSQNPTKALGAYKQICEHQPYPKVFSVSMFLILSAALRLKKGRKSAFYQQVIQVMESQGSKSPHYIEGAALFVNGEMLTFLDEMKNMERKFGADEIRQMCKLAEKLNEPKVLEPLVQFYQILPKSHDIRGILYNTLVKLYGQKADIEALEVLWRSLLIQIKKFDRPHYKHVFQRCRHFYRCNNQRLPDDLHNLLEYLGDF